MTAPNSRAGQRHGIPRRPPAGPAQPPTQRHRRHATGAGPLALRPARNSNRRCCTVEPLSNCARYRPSPRRRRPWIAPGVLSSQIALLGGMTPAWLWHNAPQRGRLSDSHTSRCACPTGLESVERSTDPYAEPHPATIKPACAGLIYEFSSSVSIRIGGLRRLWVFPWHLRPKQD